MRSYHLLVKTFNERGPNTNTAPTNPHNHDSREEKIEEGKFRQKVFDTVSPSPATPLRQSYTENLQDMDENFLPPQYNKIRRGLCNKRSERMPPPPKNLQDISQCIYRKIQEVGLSQAYAKDKIFQKILKIFALPFLPENEMVAAFQFYKTTIVELFQKYPQISTFFDYVYDFWLTGNISMEIFCVFDRPTTLRTRNYCCGWNSQWNAEIRHKNPSFWVVLSKLSDPEFKSRLKMRRLSRGEKPVEK